MFKPKRTNILTALFSSTYSIQIANIKLVSNYHILPAKADIKEILPRKLAVYHLTVKY